MAKALIIYGSETGNTEKAASIVAETMRAEGAEVDVRSVTESTVAALAEPFDLYLLGVSTWGAIEDEVQEDFKSFYAEMAGADFSGKRMAVFGCGDKGYENFAKAVDYVAERAAGQGAEIVADRLKINLDPAKSETDIQAWARKLAASL